MTPNDLNPARLLAWWFAAYVVGAVAGVALFLVLTLGVLSNV
jgi:hypothetical protein